MNFAALRGHSANLVGVPTGLLASAAFNDFPLTLHIRGVRRHRASYLRLLKGSLARWLRPGRRHLTLYRGVNDFHEISLFGRPHPRNGPSTPLRTGPALVRLNNVSSFTAHRDIACEFGDTLLESAGADAQDPLLQRPAAAPRAQGRSGIPGDRRRLPRHGQHPLA